MNIAQARRALAEIERREADMENADAERARIRQEAETARGALAEAEAAERERARTAERQQVEKAIAEPAKRLRDASRMFVDAWADYERLLREARNAGLDSYAIRRASGFPPPNTRTMTPSGVAQPMRRLVESLDRHEQVLKAGGYANLREQQRHTDRINEIRRRERIREGREAMARAVPPRPDPLRELAGIPSNLRPAAIGVRNRKPAERS